MMVPPAPQVPLQVSWQAAVQTSLQLVAQRSVQPVAQVAEAKVDLQGIGLGSQGSSAVIGGKVYRVGEEKAGIKLEDDR